MSAAPIAKEDARDSKDRLAPNNSFATEGCHYYLSDGTPFYSVIGKTTGKPRPVTIADARKVNAVPSYTTVARILHKDALERYKLRQLFDAITTIDLEEGESQDAYFTRVIAASKQHAERRADEGAKLHGAIERYLLGEAADSNWQEHIVNCVDTLTQFGIDLHDGAPEKSFAHPLGFGGKCDWHCKSFYCGDSPIGPLILDFKTKDKLEIGVKKYGYSEQAMQLAAYREGLELPKARGINVFVGCEDRQVLIHEWTEDDLRVAWKKFKLLLHYWQLDHNYFPGESK